MKTPQLHRIFSWSLLAVLAAAFLMTGCVGRRIAWSPDGTRAAIFAGDGLHLCSPDGTLSGLLLPGEGMADWCPDSRRLAVLTETGKVSWPDLEKVLSTPDRQRLLAGGQTVLEQFKAGLTLDGALRSLTGFADAERNAVAVYLAQKDGVQAAAGTNWNDLRQKECSLLQIRIGTVQPDGQLTLGQPIVNRLRKMMDLKIAPGGTAIAFTGEGDLDRAFELLVAPVDGSSPPQLVARNTAYCSDWTPDGRSLVYIHSMNEPAAEDQFSLASLSKRAVLNAAGKIELAAKAEDLAGLLFDAGNKVRCLPDGRILFASLDVHLPCTALDMPQRPQLFALDPERQAGVVPLIPRSVQENLPDKPNYYEASPDGRRVAILGEKGAVVVLTLATGVLETVQPAADRNLDTAPAWRTATELSFLCSTNGQPAQLALWTNGPPRVLSAAWPEAARKDFLDK